MVSVLTMLVLSCLLFISIEEKSNFIIGLGGMITSGKEVCPYAKANIIWLNMASNRRIL